ncbi:rhodanese-like domain-containing protein [Sinomicrobium soli]|uniref:rhodanese-like domain-containing protein n=1 Tax=Sinomicrobium sp. N-1-3-6 TaxID=2219864 RepID=UPI000DCE3BE0|nr:rhodanese-like domain-containing protein [Sinomicrobium sp. N-1-3-6]RAV30839.1 rhodanese-like domain-containing protein [Sinomicrobium sp. N-1-3-6]
MKYILLFVFGLLTAGASGQVKDVDITSAGSKELQKGFLVDVRTAEEFGEGHLPGALNLDCLEPDFLAQWKNIDKETPVYVYCRTGKRSARVSKSLDSLGFQNVTNLKGGYEAWKKKEDKK